MIKSMTGYASESFIINSTKFIVEIKSVNSKILDLNIRFPHFLKAYENDLRKEISNKLHRGKIELNVNSEIGANSDEISINKEIISNYIHQLKELNDIDSHDFHDSTNQFLNFSTEKDYLKIAMRLPNAYSSKSIELDNTEIDNIIVKISIATKNLNDYRAKEGSEMEKDFRNKILVIKELLGNIEKIEKDRISKKRTKLLDEFKSAKQRKQTIVESRINEVQGLIQQKLQHLRISANDDKYVFNKDMDNHQDLIAEMAHLRIF